MSLTLLAALLPSSAHVLAWMPLIDPMPLSDEQRLLTYIPLAIIVSLVYRATKAENPRELFRSAGGYFLAMLAGMVGIGFALWAIIAWQLP